MRFVHESHSFSIRLRVTPEMTARFFDCEIHPLYATFAIVEHAEYVSRCAILPFLEPEEDAVGSAVSIEHVAPARVGEIVRVEASVTRVEGKEILCDFNVSRDKEEIARGRTTQWVVGKERWRERMGRSSQPSPEIHAK